MIYLHCMSNGCVSFLFWLTFDVAFLLDLKTLVGLVQCDTTKLLFNAKWNDSRRMLPTLYFFLY